VIESYLLALCSKRMVLKKDKEREKAAEYIIDESRKMSAMFLRLSHACNPRVSFSPLSSPCHPSPPSLLTLSPLTSHSPSPLTL
jgi:hypothetical protein